MMVGFCALEAAAGAAVPETPPAGDDLTHVYEISVEQTNSALTSAHGTTTTEKAAEITDKSKFLKRIP